MAKRRFMVAQMVFPSSYGLLAKLSETRCYFEVAYKFLDLEEMRASIYVAGVTHKSSLILENRT
jgi:hypothetical protein